MAAFVSPNHRRHRGLVLVMVFWAIVLMAVIVAVAARAGRFDTRISVHAGEHVRGRWACRAGIEKAIALLNDDPRSADCLEDFWNDTQGDLTDLLPFDPELTADKGVTFIWSYAGDTNYTFTATHIKGRKTFVFFD